MPTEIPQNATHGVLALVLRSLSFGLTCVAAHGDANASKPWKIVRKNRKWPLEEQNDSRRSTSSVDNGGHDSNPSKIHQKVVDAQKGRQRSLPMG